MPDLNLEKAIDISRRYEMIQEQLKHQHQQKKFKADEVKSRFNQGHSQGRGQGRGGAIEALIPRQPTIKLIQV